MAEITDRQQKLLKAIVKEFIDTAEAVGSINLLDKYNFKLSSATIRNEMAELVLRGYLYKKHTSAGRIPTTQGWRFFVDKIDDEKSDVNYIAATVKTKVESNLIKVRDEKSHLVRQSLNFLAMLSENATVGLVGNDLYYSGLANLTNIPEMKDEDKLKGILSILEDYYTLSDVFQRTENDDDVNVLIGEEETGKKEFKGYSVLFTKIKLKNSVGFIAVIGPNRMDYQRIISSIKYIADTLKYIVG